MPTYEIEQYELHVQTYRVEAANEAEAIKKLFDGEADPVDNSLVFVEVADDFGLPADDHPDLAKGLHARGICVDSVIPSVRDISVVKKGKKP